MTRLNNSDVAFFANVSTIDHAGLPKPGTILR